MSESPENEAPARLFVALDLPVHVLYGLGEWQADALGDPALRPVSRDSLHATLCFLGNHPEAAIGQAAAVLGQVDLPRAGVDLAFDPKPVAVPRRAPRLYALALHSERVGALQAAYSTALADAGFYAPEKRRYWPHVTVARLRGRFRGTAADEVPAPSSELPQDLLHPFGAVRVALYRSNLRPDGAQYVSLAQKNLTTAIPAGSEG